MAYLGQCLDVLDPAGGEVDVARAHRRRPLVHGPFEELERNAHAIGTADEIDARAAVGDGEEGMPIGREIEIGNDHLRTLLIIERARDANKTRRDIRLDRDLVRRCAEDAREVCAEGVVLGDPVVVPRAPAPLGPLCGEALDPLASAFVEWG